MNNTVKAPSIGANNDLSSIAQHVIVPEIILKKINMNPATHLPASNAGKTISIAKYFLRSSFYA